MIMSQAGRYAHEQNKKRHAQRQPGQAARAPMETLETATWMSQTMADCRMLAARYDNLWSIDQFVAHQPIGSGVTSEEAERRLRKLATRGFLTMSAPRQDGEFLGFRFRMTDPDLPK